MNAMTPKEIAEAIERERRKDISNAIFLIVLLIAAPIGFVIAYLMAM